VGNDYVWTKKRQEPSSTGLGPHQGKKLNNSLDYETFTKDLSMISRE
jgi:hypothetical protein